MTLWLAEKYHNKSSELIGYKMSLLEKEIQLMEAPLPWVEFTEVMNFLDI